MNYFSDFAIRFCGDTPACYLKIAHEAIYYGIQYNHSGKFYLQINKKKRHVASGSYAFFTHPNTFFEYGHATDAPRYHIFICPYGPRIHKYLESGLIKINDDSPLIKINNSERFLQTMKEIIALNKQLNGLPPRAVLLYEDLLLQVHDAQKHEHSKPISIFYHTFFQQLIQYIRQNPTSDIDFNQKAKQCNITITHFRRLFKIITGFSPLQFLIQCRLQMSANLLITSNLSILEISKKINIQNSFYFSRLFKNKYLVSPLAYRKEYIGH
ncbi:MAG: AraC family transcriptional regulator [Lentisphaeria bacterium]